MNLCCLYLGFLHTLHVVDNCHWRNLCSWSIYVHYRHISLILLLLFISYVQSTIEFVRCFCVLVLVIDKGGSFGFVVTTLCTSTELDSVLRWMTKLTVDGYTITVFNRLPGRRWLSLAMSMSRHNEFLRWIYGHHCDRKRQVLASHQDWWHTGQVC